MSIHTFTPRQKVLIAAVLRTAGELYPTAEYDGTTSALELEALAATIDNANFLNCGNWDYPRSRHT